MRICWLLLPICLASAWPVAAATGIDPCPQPLLLRFSGLPAQPPALDEVSAAATTVRAACCSSGT